MGGDKHNWLDSMLIKKKTWLGARLEQNEWIQAKSGNKSAEKNRKKKTETS